MNDAYLAGFLDADGCLSITTRGDIRVRFTNTDRRQLQLVQLALGGLGSIAVQVRGTEKHRTAYALDLSGRAAASALRSMLPHLRLKQERAELLLAAHHSPVEMRKEVWRPKVLLLNRKGPVEVEDGAVDPRVGRLVHGKARANQVRDGGPVVKTRVGESVVRAHVPSPPQPGADHAPLEPTAPGAR